MLHSSSDARQRCSIHPLGPETSVLIDWGHYRQKNNKTSILELCETDMFILYIRTLCSSCLAFCLPPWLTLQVLSEAGDALDYLSIF